MVSFFKNAFINYKTLVLIVQMFENEE